MDAVIALLPYIAMIGLFYLIIFVPERKRKKKYSEMLTGLKINDEVLTRGGIIGKIVNIKDDFVIVETGPDRARIKLSKNGVSSLLNASGEEKK